eukprot:m.7281 g.7281  ORF g.7281 m.7281 type:complete len:305 (-) comp2753_c0_seq1:50-964(-)
MSRFTQAKDRKFPFQEGEAWVDDFFFVCVADPQLGLFHNRDDSITWVEELECLAKTVEHINRLKPTFAIFLGDLTHADVDKDPELQVNQVKDLKDALSEIDEEIPLVFLSGNHDIGEVITENGLKVYKNNFGDDYFTFKVRGVRCVVLNTQAFVDDATKELADDQFKFLEETLSDDDSVVHKLVFGHIPPFLFDKAEKHDLFNLPQEPRNKLVSIAQSAGVTHWFSGHFHRNAVSADGTLASVTSSSCGAQAVTGDESEILGLKGIAKLDIGMDKSGIRIVKVTKDAIEHEYFTLDSVPDTITF